VGCDDAICMYINYCLHLQRLNIQRKWMVVKKSCHVYCIIASHPINKSLNIFFLKERDMTCVRRQAAQKINHKKISGSLKIIQYRN